MTEGQELFLILSLLYLSDCLVWVGRRTVLFVSPWCYRWQSRFANQSTGNSSGSVGLLNPLPPLGVVFKGCWSPISVSPVGVCDLHLAVIDKAGRSAQSGQCLPYEQIVNVNVDGKYLVLNGAKFSKCETTGQAEGLAELIRMSCQMRGADREKSIRAFIEAQFSKMEAVARFEQAMCLSRDVRWAGTVFFLFLYILTPLFAATYGLSNLVIPVAASMFLMATVTACHYAWAHRKLYPLSRNERWSNVVKMVLCPPVAIRAGDLLSVEAVVGFHPVVIAHILLGDNAVNLFRKISRDLHYQLRHGHTDANAIEIATWFATAERNAIGAYLKKECGITFSDLLIPPVWDGVATAYCPRCSAQFSVSDGECPDCPAVLKIQFPENQRLESTHEQQ